jgi:CheY-like chemotaxis protein
LLGGKVWAESKGPGKGSTFKVLLPLEPMVEKVEFGESVKEKRRPEKPVALVIEDDVGAAELLTKILTLEGYQVLWATDGEEGLNWVKSHKPKVVFLDLLLPRVDGWSFLRRLKEMEVDVPVVVVSILDRDEEVLKLGASDYIVKPIKRERVVQALNSLLKGNPRDVIFVVECEESDRMVDILRSLGYRVQLISGDKIGDITDSEAVITSLEDLNQFIRKERYQYE